MTLEKFFYSFSTTGRMIISTENSFELYKRFEKMSDAWVWVCHSDMFKRKVKFITAECDNNIPITYVTIE